MARPFVFHGKEVGITSSASADGSERKRIYREEENQRYFLGLLSEMVERFRTRLHVYTLMDNHYHLRRDSPPRRDAERVGEKIGAEKYSAISKAITRFQERVKSDVRLRTLLHKASSALSYVQV